MCGANTKDKHLTGVNWALGRSVRLRISVNALRTVERKGGLDAFLLDAADDKLSLKARRLKRAVAKAVAVPAAT